MSFSKLNKIIKENKKAKAQQIKKDLDKIENEIINKTNKVHIPGIGYLTLKTKKYKKIKNHEKLDKNECECPVKKSDNWKDKIQEVNKEEEIIENVTHFVDVETNHIDKLQKLVNQIEPEVKRNSKI